MAQQIAVTPIIGLPTFAGWSQVVVARTDTNITAVIAVAITGEGAASIGSHLVTAIKDNPPRSAEALYHLFEESVLNIVELGCSCSLSGGVFRQGRSILAAYDGAVALKRDRTIAPVLNAETQIQLLQGRSQLDDVYIFTTADAKEFVSGITLTYEKGYDTDSVVTTIVPSLHAKDDSSRAAIAFGQVVEQLDAEHFEPAQPTVQEQASPQEELDSQNLPASQQQPPLQEEFTAQSEQAERLPSDIEDSEPNTAAFSSTKDLENTMDVNQLETDLANPDVSAVESTASTAAFSPQPKTLHRQSKPIKIRLADIKKTVGMVIGQIKAAYTLLISALRFTAQLAHKLLFPSKYVEYKKLQRWRLIVAIALGLIVIALTTWFVLQIRAEQLESAAAATIEPYQTRIVDIRNSSESDLLTARDQAQALLEELTVLRSTASDANNAQLLRMTDAVIADAEQLVTDISGREELAELPVAYDLRSTESDFLASSLYAVGERLLAFDREKKRGLLVDAATQAVTPVDLSNLSDIRAITPASSGDTALLLSAGIQSVGLSENSSVQEIIPEGDSNREATHIASFGSFVYVLNPERRNIYRYVQSAEGFSDPIGWLTGPLGISFEEVHSWVIDGDIWIGTQDGRVRKYTTGRQAEFEISGLEQPFTGRLALFTTPEFEQLYVLEPDLQRIVVLNKAGQFLRQITHVTLASATGFVVTPNQDTIYVASGSTIFSIPLVY